VPVTGLDGVGDSLADLSRLGLPCAQTDGRDGGTGVELERRNARHFDYGR
jgi:hypothetical protein